MANKSKTEKPNQAKQLASKTKMVIKEEPNSEEFSSPKQEKGGSYHGGRRDLYLEKVEPFLKDIQKYVRCGCTEEQIRTFYGVGHTTWNTYKKQHIELKETLLEGKREFKMALVNTSYRVAIGYKYIEIDTTEIYDEEENLLEKRVITHSREAKPDSGMLMFLLINRFPDEFARDPQTIEIRKKAMELAAEGKLTINTEGI